MGAEKRLQRLMDRVAKKGGNTITIDGTDRGELQEKLTDNKASSSQWKRAKRLADKVMPEDKHLTTGGNVFGNVMPQAIGQKGVGFGTNYQGVKPVKNMSDKQAQSIDEDSYPPTSRKSALNMLGVSNPLNIDIHSRTVDPKTEKPKRTPPSKDPDEFSHYSESVLKPKK
jgi:hypothetical protein